MEQDLQTETDASDRKVTQEELDYARGYLEELLQEPAPPATKTAHPRAPHKSSKRDGRIRNV